MVRASTRRSAGYVISCFKFRNLFFLSQKLKQARGTNCLPLGSDHKQFHMSMSHVQSSEARNLVTVASECPKSLPPGIQWHYYPCPYFLLLNLESLGLSK